MQLLRVLLAAPFSFVWLCVTNIRNTLYDLGMLKSTGFSIPVICVGNLAVGGTGKTPTINYLIAYLLSMGKNVAVISRGYGRVTKGFLVVDELSGAASVGDEPLLFFKRWSGKVVVAVGEKRVLAIRNIRERYPKLDVILMDDGFQHRAVQPSASIVLTSFQNPFYRDFIMPSGSLREGRRWARRADIIVVTKSPQIMPEVEKGKMRAKIQTYAQAGTPVFFCSIQYGRPVSFGKKGEWHKRVFLITGIANPAPLLDYLKIEGIEVVTHWERADHFAYNDQEMEKIVDEYQNSGNCVILTTEKDYVKMSNPKFQRYLDSAPFFYIPIEFSFSKEKENFEAVIAEKVTKNLGKSV
ncbi:tetraacyldisaccharide 4'-kinase [Imperialibacter roseus]|uniref:Tetraacyldisaccharide 4'-kinase n=1 Tax=Imperialibacter roseus TaxID=1324217 RepID=A0ABZ0IUN8_9BACT|nr:tetraacyldisaccharide 4'-kinase [Imperialibacter roseus]WOK08689.1 tetraacyldisaccharide 4'-kinase [Imperialibacter roseus]